MPLRILVVPDKFKGTLPAEKAAALIAQGWTSVRQDDALALLPMSDGGDGFGEVLAKLLKVEARSCDTLDAAHRPHQATWWWDSESRTAILESARVVGLSLLPPGQFHPFALDTYGLAALIQTAATAGSMQGVMGIGGSATNDGGFGLARALGWKFIGANGGLVTRWSKLAELDHLKSPDSPLHLPEIRVAVDVQNPLLGPSGASRIYGPQKGLRPDDMPIAEACLGRLAEVVQRQFGLDAASEPGSGAAGGLGFGLRSFLGARLESGFRLFAQYARLEERIRLADLVITGEGAIDASTFMGKGVGQVAEFCCQAGVPCLGLAGTFVETPNQRQEGGPFTRVYGIVPGLTSPQAAQAQPEVWLPRLAALAAGEWNRGKAWQRS